MTPSRRHAHCSTLSLLFLMLGIAMIAPPRALATDIPLSGGPGGNYFRAECPKGSYLVGLAGRTGEWVDRVGPVCAPWLRGSQSFGTPTVGSFFGASGGGHEDQRTCWESGAKHLAVQSWLIDTLGAGNRFIQYIEAHCTSLTTSVAVGFWDFGPRSSAAEERLTSGPYSRGCPPGEIAVGIHGRAGLFVDALGLICGPKPVKAGAPIVKLPSPLIQAPPPATPMSPHIQKMMVPDDMFVITRPSADDRVQQNQLVIKARAPKVGMTNVTELELRYLDAPADQRNSYPYVTLFSVDTTRLILGYPVAPSVTGGHAGRWQVRARSSMKAVPGPWSEPVQFTLLVTQPLQSSPSSQPKSLLPPSSVQAPSSPGSAGSQMVRPPSGAAQGMVPGRMLVRPRGVEGQESGDMPPESAPEQGPASSEASGAMEK